MDNGPAHKKKTATEWQEGEIEIFSFVEGLDRIFFEMFFIISGCSV